MTIRYLTKFKFFYSLVGLTFICLVVFSTIVKPVVKQESGYGDILPELRVPLTVEDSKKPEESHGPALIGAEAVKQRMEKMTQQEKVVCRRH